MSERFVPICEVCNGPFRKEDLDRCGLCAICREEGNHDCDAKATPSSSPCRDGEGHVSHDFIGDKCIRCGQKFRRM